MPINKEKKVQILDDLNQKFEKTKINILINYAGLTTEQISALRDELEEKRPFPGAHPGGHRPGT